MIILLPKLYIQDEFKATPKTHIFFIFAISNNYKKQVTSPIKGTQV